MTFRWDGIEYWHMNKISIECFPDNSFYITYGNFRSGTVAWCKYTESWYFNSQYDAINLGNAPLPDWTSIMQYLQELN